MHKNHLPSFGASALTWLAVVGTTGWAVTQSPRGDDFMTFQTAVLAAAALQALYQCWVSASTWIEPRSLRPLGWMRTELALMAMTALLGATVIAASGLVLGRAGTMPLGMSLATCGALALSFCALGYAAGRIGLLVRKGYKRRRYRVWHASQGLRAADRA